MGSLCFCDLACAAHIGWEGWLFAILAFLEFVLIVVINTLLLNEVIKDTSDLHSQNVYQAEFYCAGLYVVMIFFIYQALRAIHMETMIDMYIAISLALFAAMWLTNHIVNKTSYSYASGFFEGLGFFLSIAAWVCFVLLTVLGVLAGREFGFRAWNKVGGLAEQISVYEVTRSFRSTLRLDVFAVAFSCYTAWFYVFDTPGILACTVFFAWTLFKDLTMYFSIERGFTRTTRILRLTSFDILVAVAAVIVYDFKWHGSEHVEDIIVTYVAVVVAVLATRVLVIKMANRSLKEVAKNREQRETLVSIN